MHIRKKLMQLIIVIFIVLVFLSCSLKQTLYIDKNAAGNIDFELTLVPFFIEVTEQLSELFPGEDNSVQKSTKGPFDLEKIREDFSKNKGSVLQQLDTPSDNILHGSIKFDDIRIALNGTGSNNILDLFSFTTKDGIFTLTVVLNYETVKQFLLSNPSMNSPLMETFGPLANKGLTEEDYLDMMQFALGGESSLGIKESFLSLNVDVKGNIISQSGGLIVDHNTVKFKIPLLQVLILDEPKLLSVSFSE